MVFETERPGASRADAIVRAYLTEVASRWYGRVATSIEVDRAMFDEPFDDLQGDAGLFVVASDGGAVVACAGVRFVGAVGELAKVFTLPEHRGRGIGSALLRHVEGVCRIRGITSLRLATRAELAEACALYERLGFVRVLDGAAPQCDVHPTSPRRPAPRHASSRSVTDAVDRRSVSTRDHQQRAPADPLQRVRHELRRSPVLRTVAAPP